MLLAKVGVFFLLFSAITRAASLTNVFDWDGVMASAVAGPAVAHVILQGPACI